jgi:hypothetical protein
METQITERREDHFEADMNLGMRDTVALLN